LSIHGDPVVTAPETGQDVSCFMLILYHAWPAPFPSLTWSLMPCYTSPYS